MKSRLQPLHWTIIGEVVLVVKGLSVYVINRVALVVTGVCMRVYEIDRGSSCWERTSPPNTTSRQQARDRKMDQTEIAP